MSYPLDGTFSATAATNQLSSAGHGLVEDQRIKLLGKSILPSPLEQGRSYYVLGIVGDAFKVSLTPGGSQADISEDGAGALYICKS